MEILIVLGVVGVFIWLASGSDSGSASRDDASAVGDVAPPGRDPRGPRDDPSQGRTQSLFRQDYVSGDRELEVLVLDAATGMPQLKLVEIGDRLVLVTPRGEVINPRSRNLYKLGIFSFAIRGTAYHPWGTRMGDFRPGTPIRLEREPDNPHDANAIAAYAPDLERPAGYVNKQNAGRLAKLIDAGVEIEAIATRGSESGAERVVPCVMACSADLMGHLRQS